MDERRKPKSVNKPHKWAKEIHAWADGAKIQARNTIKDPIHWMDISKLHQPTWSTEDHIEFRIKPEPTPKIECRGYIRLVDGIPTWEDSEINARYNADLIFEGDKLVCFSMHYK